MKKQAKKTKRKRRNKISPFIIKFSKEISDASPILVPIRPIEGLPVNECFPIVEEHVAQYGGKRIIGWCVCVWKKVLIEAEFHCIWESQDGELLDITPKSYEGDLILFLPDPKREYTGRQVDNIRM